MQRYTLKINQSRRYHIEVEFKFEAPHDNPVIQVPFWRPGRYEWGNFARNIIGFEARNATGRAIARKISGHNWQVESMEGEVLTVNYTLYARELSAGNTYFDRHVLLINPVNALVYVIGSEEMESEISLDIPADWETATSLESVDSPTKHKVFYSPDLQCLMDTPILAAAHMERSQYTEAGTKFHIDIYGETALDRERMVTDFKAFTKLQIETFGGFPTDEYRFLFLLMPFRTHHGVEHERSTVIVLGPADDMDKPELYNEFLGISSHELYHTWNVKRFRPKEWTPYDYSKAGPSRLGYVVEGVTTYMGDKMLWQAGVFNDREFLSKLAVHLQRHLHSRGRFNLSLADASVDTWVDGYGRGTPNRRISIYNEGAMLALVIDIWILKATAGAACLSTVMNKLYERTDPQVGYSEEDFWNIVSEVADADWAGLRAEVLDDRGYLEGHFRTALAEVDLEVVGQAPASHLKADYGLHLEEIDGRIVVWNIDANSPADRSDLMHDDVVLEINEASAKEFLETDHNFSPVSLRIGYQAGLRRMREMMRPNSNMYFHEYEIRLTSGRSRSDFELWKHRHKTAAGEKS